MTLRERIADWISGGALRRAWLDAARHEAGDMLRGFAEARADLLQERLNRIAACETPGANSTVRRMAKIAREAVE